MSASAFALCLASCQPHQTQETARGSADLSAPVVLSEAPGSLGKGAIRLELEQVFGADTDDPTLLLGRVTSITRDSAGTIYAIDAQSNEIVAFGDDGALRWRAGGLGAGPGELNWPGTIAAVGTKLWLVNQLGQQLDVFDLNGEYVSTRPFGSVGSAPTQLCGGYGASAFVVLGELGQWTTSVTRFVTDDGDAPSSLDSTAVVDVAFEVAVALSSHMAFSTTTTCARDEILIHEPGAYSVQRWSHAGIFLGVLGRTDTGHNPPVFAGEVGQIGVPVFFPNPPLPLDGGRILVIAQWMTNQHVAPDIAEAMLTRKPIPEREWRHSLDIYDADNTLLSTLEADGEAPYGRPVMSDGVDRVYTIADEPFPQIRRYRVVTS